MKSILFFFRRQGILTVTLIAAICSMFLAPPSAAYLDYFDSSVLILIFCLMAVVAGLTRTGVFARLSAFALKRVHSLRPLAFVLTCLCFFTSMIVTNDVALLTFVPLTLGLLRGRQERAVIYTVVMETAAANLGSLVTPIGNPQNLFLYTYYHMTIGEFFRLTLPLGGISLLLLLLMLLLLPNDSLPRREETAKEHLDKKLASLYGGLFLLCIFTVLNVTSHIFCLLVLVVILGIFDRKCFLEVDYALLLTFVCFFIFVGNLMTLNSLTTAVKTALKGKVLLSGILFSQVISNVPTAILLSSFTEEAPALLLGVNIGGVGTPVASLASLISFKVYCRNVSSQKGRYLLVFTGINILLLALLWPVGKWLLGA